MQGSKHELNIERIIKAINKSSAIIYGRKNLAFGLPVNQNVPKTKINVRFQPKRDLPYGMFAQNTLMVKWFRGGHGGCNIKKGWDICISGNQRHQQNPSGKIKIITDRKEIPSKTLFES